MIKLRATNALRKIMDERDIMQKTMAADLWVHPTTIQKIVSGKTGSTFTAEIIAEYLGVEIADIFREVTNVKSNGYTSTTTT